MPGYDEYAHKWAGLHRNGNNLAHSLLEKPAMFALLPSIAEKTILCLGCGTGEECSEFLQMGASKVIGVDKSEPIISYARIYVSGADFEVADISNLHFPYAKFDFVYSSLALHYCADWLPIFKSIFSFLKPGGQFLFSTHHPVKWGSEITRSGSASFCRLGYERPGVGLPTVYGDYLSERQINDVWFGDLEVTFYHRPLETIFKDVLASGFVLSGFYEPRPLESCRKTHPEFWEIHSKLPPFMIFDLRKPS